MRPATPVANMLTPISGQNLREALPLHDRQATRTIEQAALAQCESGALMQRAGEAVARLAMAIAPHARHFAVMCGAGNNGGDGLVAATHLHQLAAPNGWRVSVLMTDGAPRRPDAMAAWRRAQAAGLTFVETWPQDVDVAIDAVFGIGAQGPLPPALTPQLAALHQAPVVLAIDVPTGLDTDTGEWLGPPVPSTQAQRHTLSLLTLKPGLFTAHGRDVAGQVWWHPLASPSPSSRWHLANAALGAPPPVRGRAHASHKGSYGEVFIIGGQLPHAQRTGMLGAAMLAARAALHYGAGRVYLCPLGEPSPLVDPLQPDIMIRSATHWHAESTAPQAVWVVGCGGGQAIDSLMPEVAKHPGPIVLDADALNALANDTDLQQAFSTTPQHARVFTPHPLEAARLLGCSASEIQRDRLRAAQTLADRFQAVVVLKGSGTIVAAPNRLPIINPTGNARLAIAGTGDVLAGMIGAQLALAGVTSHGQWQREVAQAVWTHGLRAQQWPAQQALTAAALAVASSDQNGLQQLQAQNQSDGR